jgi:Mrp family chromosome partitioning ATPase
MPFFRSLECVFQTLEVSGAIVVSTPQKVALADATKAAKMFQLVEIL